MLFSSLPIDIVHHILSYNENLKPRNGKYMGQISKSDKRYKMLLKIPRKINTMYTNYGYFINVGKLLTIKVYTYDPLLLSMYNLPLEFEYYFLDRSCISYIPK